jgi:endonuclease/exonuclease/phosphatase family metal-dependent hydrolase
MVTSVKLKGERVTIGMAHLHSRCAPAKREHQMATYLASFPPSGRAIFAGDLNTTTMELASIGSIAKLAVAMLTNSRRFRAPQRHEPLFERLREAGLEIDGANVPNRATFTFSKMIPLIFRPKLDWIALRELRPVAGSAAVIAPRHSILAPRASDHDFVMIDVEF